MSIPADVYFVLLLKHKSVFVYWKHACCFLVMFVVIEVTKVVTGEMRDVYTKIMKGKCHKCFLEGFQNTLVSSVRNLLTSWVSASKTCVMEWEKKYHSQECWQPFILTKGLFCPSSYRESRMTYRKKHLSWMQPVRKIHCRKDVRLSLSFSRTTN